MSELRKHTAWLQSPAGETREVAEDELVALMIAGWNQVAAPVQPVPEEEKIG